VHPRCAGARLAGGPLGELPLAVYRWASRTSVLRFCRLAWRPTKSKEAPRPNSRADPRYTHGRTSRCTSRRTGRCTGGCTGGQARGVRRRGARGLLLRLVYRLCVGDPQAPQLGLLAQDGPRPAVVGGPRSDGGVRGQGGRPCAPPASHPGCSLP